MLDASAEKARELVPALDCMPLAITQAAAYIMQRTPRMSVARYLALLANDHHRSIAC